MQFIQLGYVSDEEWETDGPPAVTGTPGTASYPTETYECGRCNIKTSNVYPLGRVTLSVEDHGYTVDQLWTNTPLVEDLISKPAAEWGEPGSDERRTVRHMLDEWTGYRYRARIRVVNHIMYCQQIRKVDGQVKKRRI